MCPILAPGFQGFYFSFFAAAVKSTNEANKAGSTPVKQSIYSYMYMVVIQLIPNQSNRRLTVQ